MKYHVSHILVKNKYEAEDILKKLKSGDSFESLAKRFSLCSSSKNGGDLGLLKIGQADQDFEEACLKMQKGEVSTLPLRTKFGYHILKKQN